MEKFLKIFNTIANEQMIHFDIDKFAKTHSRLLGAIVESMEISYLLHKREEFDKHFLEVNPKNIIEFIKNVKSGELYAFNKELGDDFLITEAHNPVELINTQLYWFGTEK